MATYKGRNIIVGIHEFKSDIARYMRLLESGAYNVVFVKRHEEIVCAFAALEDAKKRYQERSAEREF